jgi:hypothetical protein
MMHQINNSIGGCISRKLLATPRALALAVSAL